MMAIELTLMISPLAIMVKYRMFCMSGHIFMCKLLVGHIYNEQISFYLFERIDINNSHIF